MKLNQRIWLSILLNALGWLVKNTEAKLYTSKVPIGKRIGGHDILELQDSYLIFDARIAGRIIELGYFQYT